MLGIWCAHVIGGHVSHSWACCWQIKRRQSFSPEHITGFTKHSKEITCRTNDVFTWYHRDRSFDVCHFLPSEVFHQALQQRRLANLGWPKNGHQHRGRFRRDSVNDWNMELLLFYIKSSGQVKRRNRIICIMTVQSTRVQCSICMCRNACARS